MIDELVTERAKMLEGEIKELETQADKLAQEIAELIGEEPSRIG
jgi:phage shock protein A